MSREQRFLAELGENEAAQQQALRSAEQEANAAAQRQRQEEKKCIFILLGSVLTHS